MNDPVVILNDPSVEISSGSREERRVSVPALSALSISIVADSHDLGLEVIGSGGTVEQHVLMGAAEEASLYCPFETATDVVLRLTSPGGSATCAVSILLCRDPVSRATETPFAPKHPFPAGDVCGRVLADTVAGLWDELRSCVGAHPSGPDPRAVSAVAPQLVGALPPTVTAPAGDGAASGRRPRELLHAGECAGAGEGAGAEGDDVDEDPTSGSLGSAGLISAPRTAQLTTADWHRFRRGVWWAGSGADELCAAHPPGFYWYLQERTCGPGAVDLSAPPARDRVARLSPSQRAAASAAAAAQRLPSSEGRETVEKDVPRTARDCVGALRAALRRVLLCTDAVLEGGYCQAVNFVAFDVLRASGGDEELAFWVSLAMLRRYMPGYHDPDLFGTTVDIAVLEQLAETALPGPMALLHTAGVTLSFLVSNLLMCAGATEIVPGAQRGVWDAAFALACVRCRPAEAQARLFLGLALAVVQEQDSGLAPVTPTADADRDARDGSSALEAMLAATAVQERLKSGAVADGLLARALGWAAWLDVRAVAVHRATAIAREWPELTRARRIRESDAEDEAAALSAHLSHLERVSAAADFLHATCARECPTAGDSGAAASALAAQRAAKLAGELAGFAQEARGRLMSCAPGGGVGRREPQCVATPPPGKETGGSPAHAIASAAARAVRVSGAVRVASQTRAWEVVECDIGAAPPSRVRAAIDAAAAQAPGAGPAVAAAAARGGAWAGLPPLDGWLAPRATGEADAAAARDVSALAGLRAESALWAGPSVDAGHAALVAGYALSAEVAAATAAHAAAVAATAQSADVRRRRAAVLDWAKPHWRAAEALAAAAAEAARAAAHSNCVGVATRAVSAPLVAANSGGGGHSPGFHLPNGSLVSPRDEVVAAVETVLLCQALAAGLTTDAGRQAASGLTPGVRHRLAGLVRDLDTARMRAENTLLSIAYADAVRSALDNARAECARNGLRLIPTTAGASPGREQTAVPPQAAVRRLLLTAAAVAVRVAELSPMLPRVRTEQRVLAANALLSLASAQERLWAQLRQSSLFLDGLSAVVDRCNRAPATVTAANVDDTFRALQVVLRMDALRSTHPQTFTSLALLASEAAAASKLAHARNLASGAPRSENRG